MISNLPNSSQQPAKAHSRWVSKTLAVAMVCCFSSFCQAGIMVGDWKTANDGLLTIDTTQGLEFLDVTQSANRAVVDVLTEFGVGGDFEGFRYATEKEVVSLVNEIGWTSSPAFSAGTSSTTSVSGEALAILGLIGTTFSSRSSTGASGVTSTDAGRGTLRAVTIFQSSRTQLATATGTFDDSSKSSSVASFLVRASTSSAASGGVVPEPSSFAMFGLVSVGLLVARRRKC